MREQSSNKCSISNLLPDFEKVGALYLGRKYNIIISTIFNMDITS